MQHTFLVTDGDRTSLELISAVLTRDGFEVVATPDGADALARARESTPAVVICAAELPGLSGEELCRQIKAQSSDTRVVLLHREGPEGADAQAVKLTAGCDAIIETPFKYPALKKHLVDWGLLSDAGSPSAATVPAPDSFGVPVPAPEPIKFEAPGPVSPPDTAFRVATTATPASASAPSSPFTPIPLPVAPATPQFDDDLPELELDAVAEDSVPGPRAAEPALTPAAPAAQTSPPAPSPAPAAVQRPSGQLTLPLEGDLAQVPLPRLLYELYVATFTGVVQITRASVARTVFIRSGTPVHVDSHQMAEMLGRLLVEHGRITMDEYARSLQVMQTQGIRQGEALVQIGALRQSELLDAMRLQTEVKLSNAFTWRDGRYRIEPGSGFEGGTILCEVQPIRAIWRGVHEHYDLESLLTYFAGLTGKYAVATEMFAVQCDAIAPYIRDLELLPVLDGSTTFDAALADRGRQLRVAQALYVLLVTDMIEAADGPGAAAAIPDAPQSAAAPGAGPAARGAAAKTVAAAPASPEELQRIADEIARDYLRLKESDYFDALRLEPTSTADEVDVAYENLVRALRLDDLPAGLPQDVVSRAREIGDVLNRARMVLRDPRMRERYLASQQQRYALPGDPSVGAQPEQAAAPMAGNATLELDVDGSRQASIIAERAYQVGLGLMQAERYEDAGRKFQEAIAAAPREPAYRVALGRAIVSAEGIRHEATRHKAATCVQQALQLDPSNLEANLEMAKLLAASGKRDRAYSYVQRVLQRSPDHPEARQVLASLG